MSLWAISFYRCVTVGDLFPSYYRDDDGTIYPIQNLLQNLFVPAAPTCAPDLQQYVQCENLGAVPKRRPAPNDQLQRLGAVPKRRCSPGVLPGVYVIEAYESLDIVTVSSITTATSSSPSPPRQRQRHWRKIASLSPSPQRQRRRLRDNVDVYGQEQSSQDKVTGVFKFYFGEFPFKCLPLLLEDFEHVRPCFAGCKRFAHLARAMYGN